ncbi:MAG: hypothetical protein ACK4S3_07450 [Parvibaculum sp.]
MFLLRLVEELFPFPHYFVRARRQRRRCECPDILKKPDFKDYPTLSAEQLNERLKEERVRASALDDKTFKLTLSLSVGLTVLSSTAAFLIRAVTSPSIQATLTIAIGMALFYVLSAGFVALGALRTLPSYGYGTYFLLQQQSGTPNVVADALARQERMNNIRHLRNETAYQALRNGLILLFVALLVFAATLVYQDLCPAG